jgi:hypothetical protein
VTDALYPPIWIIFEKNAVVSKKHATFFEKMPTSRRSARSSSRKCQLLEEARDLLRESAIFSITFQGDADMHPLGVQFGLSRGLQLRGEEVLLFDSLLEAISAEGRLYVCLGKPAIHGNFLVT